jgi:hypothetical protein
MVAVLAEALVAGVLAVVFAEASVDALFFFRLDVLVVAVALWSVLALGADAAVLEDVSAVVSFLLFFFFDLVVVVVEVALWSCVLCA